MVVVVFTKEFAGKKVGEEFECDSMLASTLINSDKVAVKKEDYTPKKKATKKK